MTTARGAKGTGSQEGTKWFVQLLVSVVVPAAVAAFTTECALNREIDEGQAVFSNIGYRYFGAVYQAYDPNTGQFRVGSQAHLAYRTVLSDIAEDIRWLRTNPLYGKLQATDKEAVLALAQNALARETGGAPLSGVDSVTLTLFCSIYEPGIKQGRMWTQTQRRPSTGATSDSHVETLGNDLVTFGKRLCDTLTQSVP